MKTLGVILVLWILSGGLSYLLTEIAILCCSSQAWDRSMREFAIVCGIILGPVYLLISMELLLLALMGSGLITDHKRRYRDS